MNREIKFRVYDKVKKIWIYGPGREVNLIGETILLGGFLNGVNVERLNDLEILQYTGRKDKYGTEIYEGDLLKIVCGDSETGEDLSWIGHIKYDIGFSQFRLYKDINFFTLSSSEVYAEIVGNVYE